MYPLAVLSHLRPRFAYIRGPYGHTRSQGGRQHAAAKPFCMTTRNSTAKQLAGISYSTPERETLMLPLQALRPLLLPLQELLPPVLLLLGCRRLRYTSASFAITPHAGEQGYYSWRYAVCCWRACSFKLHPLSASANPVRFDSTRHRQGQTLCVGNATH